MALTGDTHMAIFSIFSDVRQLDRSDVVRAHCDYGTFTIISKVGMMAVLGFFSSLSANSIRGTEPFR
jgi:hypothetical protein